MSKMYTKEKAIGSGSFGSVWLVKAKGTNNAFVLKELNFTTMNAAETQHALTEVTVLSRCRHRNIIRYKDAVIDHKKGLLSIIMEYAEGGDLYTAIIKQDCIPFKEHTVLKWFTQISLALQYIHHKSILHRDLKTRNIFLTRDRQIKVGDFGIARCLMETNELATTAIGTPYYLSPEICQRKPYSFKSDIWALGCILFEIASLSHPFQASSFPQLLSLILTGQRKELPGYCSSLIKDLVELLLKENPEDRPSADDILAIPQLQTYLSEVWILQNDTGSSLSRKLSEKMCLGRQSSANVSKVLADREIKRRSSVSSVDSRISKSKHGLVSRLKSVTGQKSSPKAQPLSLKESKFSSIRMALKSDPFSTYKVSDPIALKRTKISISGLNFLTQKKKTSKPQNNSKRSQDNDESDRGYQSEEILKYGASGKLSDYSIQKTSTKKHLDTPDFEIDHSIFNDDVFQKSSSKLAISEKPSDIVHITDCCHSQCQECMLDMLWKNRIKGPIRPMSLTDERTELIRKLQLIFGVDLFREVYHTMISNWDTREHNRSPKCIKDIARSLNYSQVQHLPLMMQLIQLDVISK